MEMTCRDAFRTYLQTQGGCDERRFVNAVCGILANCVPMPDHSYISYSQYRFMYTIITRLFYEREVSLSSALKVLYALSEVRIGTYNDEERPIEDLVNTVLMACDVAN